MELKCDSCQNHKYSAPSGWQDVAEGGGDPYGYNYCSLCHWDMDCPDEAEYNDVKAGVDPRKDCVDYVSTKQQVYVLMGLPGAGKTTWAKKKLDANNNTIVIGRDGIRYMLSAGYSYDSSQKHQDFVYKASYYLIENGLLEGFDIIIDQLSLGLCQRFDTYNHIKEFCRVNGLWCDVHLIHLTEDEENVQRRLDSNMRWGDREYYENLIKKLKESTEDVGDFEEFDSYSQVDKNGDIKKIW